MRYGFVIDQDRCIGCHACTVACKEEHQVPVGVFRTWVKHIEKGEFPHTSRHFGVMRCNHCDESPCTTICPTSALYRRADGIVDFDNRRCIGCKACMQACPYDALYIDPNTNTAAKCNFCAHRVEKSIEPACVIVCPTQAILAGDLDDSGSNVARVVATRKVSVRKPQKGTQPKLFYVGIKATCLSQRGCRERTRISGRTAGTNRLTRGRTPKSILLGRWHAKSMTCPIPHPGAGRLRPIFGPKRLRQERCSSRLFCRVCLVKARCYSTSFAPSSL